MSETEKKKKQAPKPDAPKADGKDRKDVKDEKPAPQPDAQKLEEQVEQLTLQLKEETERVLRISAEYDNFKKRTAKEKEELYELSLSAVLTGLLPVFDNLERARLCKDYDTLKSGVEMILNSFSQALTNLHVTEIEALGKEFDPACHEAVLTEVREDYEPNTVCEVLQKGYRIKDRVLRHAMVKVASKE